MQDFKKTYISPDDQIALLKSRGMIIECDEQALLCLSRISYYRLSAYWYPFRASKLVSTQDGKGVTTTLHDHFRSNTVFEEIVDFYVFDKNLRLLLSDALERIEVAIRAQIADLMAIRDPLAHRSPKEVHGNFQKASSRNKELTKHKDWLASQDQNFTRSREDFAKHFRGKYGDETPPIWIAKEVWDWGMLSHFFSGMKYQDKEQIASSYGNIDGNVFASWLRMLNDIRNICAHHSRLWNRGLVSQPKLPRQGKISELDHLIGDTHAISRIYSALVIIVFMMKKLHPATQWHNRLLEHIASAPTRSVIASPTAGFPAEWENLDIWG